MGGYYNPVLSGIMNAQALAERFRRAALEEAEYRRRVSEDERRQKREEFADQLDQLKLRLSMEEMGATPTTPQDVAEAEIPRYRLEGSQIPSESPRIARYQIEGEPQQIGTGTDIRRRIMEVPGMGQFTLPSLQQRMEDVQALSRQKALAEGESARAKFQATAVPLPENIANAVGMKPGTPVKPEVIDDYIRATAGQSQSFGTGRLGEFKSVFLPGWYVQTGKPKTPANELEAYQAFNRFQQIEKGDQSLQERLAQLRHNPNPTPAERREMDAIEYAMTLVARTYGAGFKQMTTPQGQTLFINPGIGKTVEAPAGTRPQYTEGERTQIAALDELVGQAKMLRDLAEKNRSSIGLVQGRFAAWKRLVVGAGQEVNDMFRLADNMSDMLLRARSGAQINEQEYKRLRTLVPNPRWSEEKFFSDLNSFQAELERLLARRSGAAPMVQNLPGRQSAEADLPSGPSTATGPKEGSIIINKKTGQRLVLRNGQWVPVE